ncbi:MAG: hypothetical protein WCT23_09610 [Candidatus Neomarinimicrobiota bacterium]
MYNTSKVHLAFFSRVGFRDGTNDGYSVVDAANQVSESGRYFQDANALVTIPAIKDTHVDPDLSDEEFNEFLENVKKANILKAIDTVLPSPDVLKTARLFNNADNYARTIDKAGSFVGFKIVVPPRHNLKVSSITLEFNGVQDLNLYLFHTISETALQTKSITTGLGTSVTLDWDISSYDYPGGYFMLGYFADDLSGVLPYNRGWNYSECYEEFNYIGITSAYVAATSTGRPSITNLVETSETFGLNPMLSVRSDHTQVLLENVSRFDLLVSLYVAADLIERMKLSVRSDFYERQAAQAVTELEGSKEFGITGIYPQIKIETQKVYRDLFGKPVYFNGTSR